MTEAELIEIITRRVLQEIKSRPKYKRAEKTHDPKEVVIGVAPAFQSEVHFTLSGLAHEEVLSEIKAGIEEEGLTPRVIKVFKTSDVGFVGKEAAMLSGSGIAVGLQSKGTALIHHRDLYPLSNLELFPQAPLLTLDHYRRIGRNAARYVKGEPVTPVEVLNDPMVRANFQVKAALMHIKETQMVNKEMHSVEWGEAL